MEPYKLILSIKKKFCIFTTYGIKLALAFVKYDDYESQIKKLPSLFSSLSIPNNESSVKSTN